MPRDRKPNFKKQVKINGRVIGIPDGMTKKDFIDWHKENRVHFNAGTNLGFHKRPAMDAIKAAARADGLIPKSDNEHHEKYSIEDLKKMGKYS